MSKALFRRGLALAAAGPLLLLLAACGGSSSGDEVASERPKAVKSYQECVDAGYPQLKTFPGQCIDGEGNRFVDERKPIDIPKEPYPGFDE